MSAPLLQVTDLSVTLGDVQILHNVNIAVEDDGQIGLFGPNGHGKTTLLETISGLHRPSSGSITFEGEEIQTLSPGAIVDRGLIHVPQGNTLFPRMTVLENLQLGAYSKRTWSGRDMRVKEVFELFPRLAERSSQLCRTLSGGERQMLAVGVGLMGDAKLLMLDEPTLGLSPRLKNELREAISRIANTGVPFIVVEQDVEFLLGLAKRLYLIQDGRVALETTAGDSRLKHSEILDMYFGRTPGQAADLTMKSDDGGFS